MRFAEFLRAAGTALYGPEWIQPIGRDLGVGPRTAQRWAAGEIEPRKPDEVRDQIRALLRERRPAIEAECRERIKTIAELLAA